MLAAVRGRNLVAEMPGEPLDGGRAADAEAEAADRRVDSVEAHGEPIRGHPTARDVRRVAAAELEPQVAIAENSDVVEQRHGPDHTPVGAILSRGHSLRNAVSGSTGAARNAGTQFATSVASPITTVTAASVQRSCGLTPYSNPVMNRVAATAPRSPTTSPTPATAIPWRT